MTSLIWPEIQQAFQRWTGVVLSETHEIAAVDALRSLARTVRLEPLPCLRVMHGDRNLRQSLIDEMNIGLTWFLRDRASLFALAQNIASARAVGASKTAWVWSIGCSTGEEPYSIAMVLLNRGIEPRILATDMNRRFLRAAMGGIYPERSLDRLPVQWREQYFEPHGERRVRAKDVLRRSVTFELHNLAESTAPPRGWSEFDAVVCRNVLLFAERQRARGLVRELATWCRPEGFLTLGAIERPLLWEARVQRAREPEPIIRVSKRRRAQTVPEAPRRWPASSAPEVVPPADLREADPPSGAQRAYQLVERGQAARALRLVGEDGTEDPLSSQVQIARGMALKQTGRLREAVAAFRAARFLEWEAWLAPYELGLCLEALGDHEDATEAYRHAISVLNRGGHSGVEELSDSIESMRLSVADACRLRLELLRRRR